MPNKRFEKAYVRRRNQIEKIGIRLFRNAIEDQYDQFLRSIANKDINQWAGSVNAMSDEPISNAMLKYYKRFAPLALMQRNQLISLKEDDDRWMVEFERFLSSYVLGEHGDTIAGIAETTRKRVLGILEKTLAEGELAGLSVDEIQRNILKNIGMDLKGNAIARARAIAQTEIVGGSNRAAMYAAETTGLTFRKFWSTVGDTNVRASHTEAENYSADVGGLRQNQLFPNGLRYPGDPRGEAAEVIQCRCALLLAPV